MSKLMKSNANIRAAHFARTPMRLERGFRAASIRGALAQPWVGARRLFWLFSQWAPTGVQAARGASPVIGSVQTRRARLAAKVTAVATIFRAFFSGLSFSMPSPYALQHGQSYRS